MTVYVDVPVYRKPNGRKRYAHAWCSDRKELESFIWTHAGMGKHFLHRKPFLHADVPDERWDNLLDAGAVCVTARQLVEMARSA